MLDCGHVESENRQFKTARHEYDSLSLSLPPFPARVRVPLDVHMRLKTRVNVPEVSLKCQFFP